MNSQMSQKWILTVRIWWASFIELLLLLPVWILFDTYLVTDPMKGWWMLGLPVLSLIGIGFRFQLDVVWKQVIAGVIIGVLYSYPAWGTTILSVVAVFVASTFVLLEGVYLARRIDKSHKYWEGLVLYFISSIVFSKVIALQSMVPLLTWVGVFCLGVALFASNRLHLKQASLSESETSGVPSDMKRHNRIFIGVIFVMTVIMATGIANSLGRLIWNMVKLFLAWIIGNGAKPPAQPDLTAPMQPGSFDLSETAEKTGWLMKLLNAALFFIGWGITIVILSWLLYRISRKLGWSARNFVEFVRRLLRIKVTFNRPKYDGYIDEESSVFSWDFGGNPFRKLLQGRSGKRTKERWKDYDNNRDRIRYLYRRWLGSKVDSGYKPKKYLTPQETHADVEVWQFEQVDRKTQPDVGVAERILVDLYYKVRYGGREIPDEDVGKVREKLK